MTRRDAQHSPDRQALKRDTKALIRAVGGVEAAAQFCRPSKTSLSDYQTGSTEIFMPIDAVVDLEAVSRGTPGFPILTRRLATMAGCSLVVLPEARALNGSWFDEIGKLAEDHGEIAAKLCKAAADQNVTADEVHSLDLIGACDDAILHLVNLRARFERIAEEGVK